MPAPHRILLLAFPHGQLLDIAGPLQMFAGANDELSRQVYRIEIAAPQAGAFATSSGVRLVADVSFAQITNRRLARIHTLITVGGEPGMRQELMRGNATDILARAIGRVPRIASVCSGTFFLAAAGALDGRRAATHWSEVEALKRFRPEVLVDGNAIHIEDRGIWTSAGVTAGMDLALAMIEADLGRKVALAIARRHVLFRIRPGGQSQFSAELVAQTAGNPKIKKLAEKVTAQPRADWRTDVLAAEAGVSRRSLSRLFRTGLDVSPADFVERVRTDLARRRLLETDDNVEAIAVACGFGSLRRMDRAFARAMSASPPSFAHASRRMEPSMSLFNVGFVIFPELTQLDFTGPQQVLARLPQSAMHIIAKSAAPVSSDSGLSLVPTHTFENCPRLDLICIPGGSTGVVRAMGDRDTIEFVQRQSVTAKYVTSVCTGAFILGAAGLLKGRRATTHWAFTELLPLVGATHEKGRVVKDGNVITAGGVTSGIDFGLNVVAEIAGDTVAQAIQLGLEYDPNPPFDAGHPDCAPDAAKATVFPRYEKARTAFRDGIARLPTM
jgi:cyclohexyl-isocyanide hydratase